MENIGMKQLRGAFAKENGYTNYVGYKVTPTGHTYDNGLVEVKIDAADIPFPLSIAVHPDDIVTIG